MGIVQITTDTTGQINVNPRRVKIITTDNLATVTTAGYLNKTSLQGYTIYSTDVIDMWYGYVSNNNPGTYSVFIPTIANGVITLAEDVSGGNVLLPVVDGDFAIFNGTTGQIRDDGFSATDDTKTKVIMLNAAPTVANHFANFSATNGTIGDAGYVPSDATKTAVSMAVTPTTNGGIAVFTDTAGTVGLNSGVTAIHLNNIQAGASGTAGTFSAFPATLNTGSHNFSATANTGNFNVFLTNSPVSQTTVNHISNPGAVTGFINTSLVDASLTPVTPIIVKRIQVSSTVLNGSAGTGKVFVIPVGILGSSFYVLDIKVCFSSSAFGGGGDKLLILTDGTTIFNGAGITSALLTTPINTLWGGTGNPLMGTSSPSFNVNSQTSAGLWFQYSGGTTNYADGGTNEIIVTLERVL